MRKLKAIEIAQFDYMFRYTHKHIVHFLLNIIYEYDAFITVASICESRNFSYPPILDEKESSIEIKGLFHPFIDNAIKNDISFSRSSNMLFVTGANMAGKSSLLKA